MRWQINDVITHQALKSENKLLKDRKNPTMYDSTQLFLVLTALLIFWLHTPGGMDDRTA